jgi:hypothetical protein
MAAGMPDRMPCEGNEMEQERRRRSSRARPLRERFALAIRRFLFPRMPMVSGMPHELQPTRAQIIAFAVVLAIAVVVSLTVLATESRFEPVDPPVEGQ